MVKSFGFLRTPKIIFGIGQLETLPSVLKKNGKNILIITGSKSFLNNDSVGKIFLSLEKDGSRIHFEKIGNEPSPSEIDQITERHRSIEISSVVALGGGSVLDTGKAVSAMLLVDGTVMDYLEGVGNKEHSGIKIPFIAIPTTSGTGSEATSNAVLSQTGADGFKRSLRHENFMPDVAIIDPALTTDCPPSITAASGMDAFTQLIESFLSTKAGPLTDALALDGIINIHENLLKAVESGNDPEARSGMSYAALLSGITLANAGLGLVHGFASSLGGIIAIPHGILCGTLMAVVNRYNINALLDSKEISTAHRKYETLGKIFSGGEDKSMSWYMQYVSEYLDGLTDKLDLLRLGSFGLTESLIEQVALKTDHKANPVKFEKDQLMQILKERI